MLRKPQTSRQKPVQKVALARKVLDAALGNSENESDEENDTYEWIYEEDDTVTPGEKQNKKTRDGNNKSGKVIGFRKPEDGLEYRVGDCVMLNPPGGTLPWVGMIKEFTGLDDDGDQCAEFMCKEYLRWY
jgi:hypothetical protein